MLTLKAGLPNWSRNTVFITDWTLLTEVSYPALALRHFKFDLSEKSILNHASFRPQDLPSPQAMGSKIWPVAVLLLVVSIGFEGSIGESRRFLVYSSFKVLMVMLVSNIYLLILLLLPFLEPLQQKASNCNIQDCRPLKQWKSSKQIW